MSLSFFDRFRVDKFWDLIHKGVMNKRLAVGLMSGTSKDGIDAVLLQTRSKAPPAILGHSFAPYTKRWKAELTEIIEKNDLQKAFEVGALWSHLADRLVTKLLSQCNFNAGQIHAIGAHGQTIYHHPNIIRKFGFNISSSIQIGDFARLALLSGIPTVGNFRAADLAAGGQGAPMAPFGHRFLFPTPKKTLFIQNMGGIGNVSVLQNNHLTMAFDTGPGNIWMDTVVHWKSQGKQSYDHHGRLGLTGKIDQPLAQRIAARSPYFQKAPPKSTDLAQLGEPYLRFFRKKLLQKSKKDAVATVTLATALVTTHQYQKFLLPQWRPEKIIVCGGGAKNKALLHWMEHLLNIPTFESGCLHVSPSHVEAASFALMALATLEGKPNNEPLATGAHKTTICGQISLPAKLRRIDTFMKG